MSFPNSTTMSVIFILVLVIPFILILTFVNRQIKKESVVQEVKASALATPSAALERIVPEEEESGEVEAIENYIKVIFGKDWRIARAIQYDECNPKRKEYPDCRKIDKIEYSCGMWQINLNAHSKKVKGKTFKEKCENLANPYYSTLIAHQIWTTSGCRAWTTCRTGQYLRNL